MVFAGDPKMWMQQAYSDGRAQLLEVLPDSRMLRAWAGVPAGKIQAHWDAMGELPGMKLREDGAPLEEIQNHHRLHSILQQFPLLRPNGR